jgi:ABC-type transporter Mla MlaB component
VLELDLSHVGEIDTAGLQLLALAKRESGAWTTNCASSATARRCAK